MPAIIPAVAQPVIPVVFWAGIQRAFDEQTFFLIPYHSVGYKKVTKKFRKNSGDTLLFTLCFDNLTVTCPRNSTTESRIYL